MSSQSRKGNSAASIAWFEIPADSVERAKKFYSSLFGRRIEKFPGMTDYWHIDTAGDDATPDGGLLKRRHAEYRGISSYGSVPSAAESAAKVQKLGGKICMPRTAVPQMGCFAICQGTENNRFAFWEMNDRVK